MTVQDAYRPSHRLPFLAPTLLTLVFLTLYFITASHGVILDNKDAAEFQTVGSIGGLAHQPYPLWSILARSLSAIPIGEPAFRVTLLSILSASFTVFVVYLLGFLCTSSEISAAAGSIALGLSQTFWLNATVAEVYTLGALLFALLLFGAIRWQATRALRDWLLVALAAGLLVSHQSVSVAIAPAALCAAWMNRGVFREGWSRARWVLFAGVFLLPFTLYGYTFLVDRGNYPVNWLNNFGQYVALSQGISPNHFDGFVERMRFQMWVGRLGATVPSLTELARSLYQWARYFVFDAYPFVGALLAVLGLVAVQKENPRRNFLWTVLSLGYIALAVTVNHGAEMHAYSIPVFVLAALYIAHGVAAVRLRPPARTRFAQVALAAVLVALPLLRYSKSSPLARHPAPQHPTASLSEGTSRFVHLRASNDNGRLYGQRVSALVPPGSVVFGRWSETNVLFYHKYVDGKLDGVEVYYRLPRDEYMRKLIQELPSSNVYFTFDPQPHGFEAVESIKVLPSHWLYQVRDLQGS